MKTVTIPVVVGADHRLVLDLPASLPIGPADVVIRSRVGANGGPPNPERDRLRAKLLAANFLSTERHTTETAEPASDEEIARLGRLPTGARLSEELIAEDRGPW
jgi:hypothetical protein